VRAVVHQAAPATSAAGIGPIVQRKTRIGPVDDALEREADRVADAIVTGMSVDTIGGATPGTPQCKCAECEDEEHTLQRKCAQSAAVETRHNVTANSAASAVSHGGAPLTPSQRAYFEPHFGEDFSKVRIHSSGDAASAARSINARAYTVGHNIAFAPGEYEPHDADTQRLLAHELVHVVQQSRGAPLIQRWASCSEANIMAQDCPDRETGEVKRAKADMVFFSEMRDPDTGQTGALIANFDIGKAAIKRNLHETLYWRQFVQLMQKEGSTWKLLGFDDCHEEAASESSLRKERAEAVYRALPEAVRPQIVSRDAAPSGACMTGNVSGADRTMNRSVALVLDSSIADFSEDDEASEVIIGKTPLDHQRECQQGGWVKTFPFRTTRFGGAPIMAHRDGDEIVVKLPYHVRTNSDFRKETDTLPIETFLGDGTRLPKEEIVRVRHYELPHWYNFNITGDASDDDKTDYCVPAEKLLDFASATNKAFWVNVAVTGVDALMLGTPVSKVVGTGVSKVVAPVQNLAQKTVVGGMLALREAAPTALAGRASASFVEGRVAQQAVTQTVAPALAAPVAETATTSALTTTVPRIGTSVAGDILPGALLAGGAEVGGGAVIHQFGDWRDFLGEAQKRVDAAKAKYGDIGAVMMATTGPTVLTRAQMQAFVEGVMQQNPILQQLVKGRAMAGAAQRDEMLNILHRFFNETGVAYEVVEDGVVQAARGAGNFASLRSSPGLFQIERSAFESTEQLTEELTHEFAFYYARIAGKTPVLQETYTALDVLELMIRNGGKYPL
jgi:Domain of unknown function (DUF4157)